MNDDEAETQNNREERRRKRRQQRAQKIRRQLNLDWFDGQYWKGTEEKRSRKKPKLFDGEYNYWEKSKRKRRMAQGYIQETEPRQNDSNVENAKEMGADTESIEILRENNAQEKIEITSDEEDENQLMFASSVDQAEKAGFSHMNAIVQNEKNDKEKAFYHDNTQTIHHSSRKRLADEINTDLDGRFWQVKNGEKRSIHKKRELLSDQFRKWFLHRCDKKNSDSSSDSGSSDNDSGTSSQSISESRDDHGSSDEELWHSQLARTMPIDSNYRENELDGKHEEIDKEFESHRGTELISLTSSKHGAEPVHAGKELYKKSSLVEEELSECLDGPYWQLVDDANGSRRPGPRTRAGKQTLADFHQWKEANKKKSTVKSTADSESDRYTTENESESDDDVQILNEINQQSRNQNISFRNAHSNGDRVRPVPNPNKRQSSIKFFTTENQNQSSSNTHVQLHSKKAKKKKNIRNKSSIYPVSKSLRGLKDSAVISTFVSVNPRDAKEVQYQKKDYGSKMHGDYKNNGDFQESYEYDFDGSIMEDTHNFMPESAISSTAIFNIPHSFPFPRILRVCVCSNICGELQQGVRIFPEYQGLIGLLKHVPDFYDCSTAISQNRKSVERLQADCITSMDMVNLTISKYFGILKDVVGPLARYAKAPSSADIVWKMELSKICEEFDSCSEAFEIGLGSASAFCSLERQNINPIDIFTNFILGISTLYKYLCPAEAVISQLYQALIYEILRTVFQHLEYFFLQSQGNAVDIPEKMLKELVALVLESLITKMSKRQETILPIKFTSEFALWSEYRLITAIVTTLNTLLGEGAVWQIFLLCFDGWKSADKLTSSLASPLLPSSNSLDSSAIDAISKVDELTEFQWTLIFFFASLRDINSKTGLVEKRERKKSFGEWNVVVDLLNRCVLDCKCFLEKKGLELSPSSSINNISRRDYVKTVFQRCAVLLDYFYVDRSTSFVGTAVESCYKSLKSLVFDGDGSLDFPIFLRKFQNTEDCLKVCNEATKNIANFADLTVLSAFCILLIKFLHKLMPSVKSLFSEQDPDFNHVIQTSPLKDEISSVKKMWSRLFSQLPHKVKLIDPQECRSSSSSSSQDMDLTESDYNKSKNEVRNVSCALLVFCLFLPSRNNCRILPRLHDMIDFEDSSTVAKELVLKILYTYSLIYQSKNADLSECTEHYNKLLKAALCRYRLAKEKLGEPVIPIIFRKNKNEDSRDTWETELKHLKHTMYIGIHMLEQLLERSRKTKYAMQEMQHVGTALFEQIFNGDRSADSEILLAALKVLSKMLDVYCVQFDGSALTSFVSVDNSTVSVGVNNETEDFDALLLTIDTEKIMKQVKEKKELEEKKKAAIERLQGKIYPCILESTKQFLNFRAKGSRLEQSVLLFLLMENLGKLSAIMLLDGTDKYLISKLWGFFRDWIEGDSKVRHGPMLMFTALIKTLLSMKNTRKVTAIEDLDAKEMVKLWFRAMMEPLVSTQHEFTHILMEWAELIWIQSESSNPCIFWHVFYPKAKRSTYASIAKLTVDRESFWNKRNSILLWVVNNLKNVFLSAKSLSTSRRLEHEKDSLAIATASDLNFIFKGFGHHIRNCLKNLSTSDLEHHENTCAWFVQCFFKQLDVVLRQIDFQGVAEEFIQSFTNLGVSAQLLNLSGVFKGLSYLLDIDPSFCCNQVASLIATNLSRIISLQTQWDKAIYRYLVRALLPHISDWESEPSYSIQASRLRCYFYANVLSHWFTAQKGDLSTVTNGSKQFVSIYLILLELLARIMLEAGSSMQHLNPETMRKRAVYYRMEVICIIPFLISSFVSCFLEAANEFKQPVIKAVLRILYSLPGKVIIGNEISVVNFMLEEDTPKLERSNLANYMNRIIYLIGIFAWWSLVVTTNNVDVTSTEKLKIEAEELWRDIKGILASQYPVKGVKANENYASKTNETYEKFRSSTFDILSRSQDQIGCRSSVVLLICLYHMMGNQGRAIANGMLDRVCTLKFADKKAVMQKLLPHLGEKGESIIKYLS